MFVFIRKRKKKFPPCFLFSNKIVLENISLNTSVEKVSKKSNNTFKIMSPRMWTRLNFESVKHNH